MKALIRKAGDKLIRRRVENISVLTSEVYASLADCLDGKGALRVPPFDASRWNTRKISSERWNWINWKRRMILWEDF